ncbi:hypothetical protein JMJ35_004991 [Cladonia borealis]|uniref:PH domain-like protein n=1 Tax=Cladonia borealis TaxID=184061 RepID=A0AA39R3K4_9LECA|nr:hypothetical protein JMJ35_004991 [Cladonia borealis]
MMTTIPQIHHYHPSDSDAPTVTLDFFSPDPNNLNNTLPPPPPNTRSDTELNISVLQRHLPSTQAIERIAPYAVVYLFSIEREGWEKSGVEGSLFIVRTYEEGREGYAVVVLNRRGLDNFVFTLKREDQVDVTEEYIILQEAGNEREGEQKAYGLWVFQEAEGSTKGTRAEIGELITELARRTEGVQQGFDGVQQGQHGQHGVENGNGPASPDLMALLRQPRTQAVPVVQQAESGQGQNVLDMLRKAGANVH